MEFTCDNFIKFESDNGLFELKVDDFSLWIYLRTTVFTEMSVKILNQEFRYNKGKPSFKRVLKVLARCTIDTPYKKCKNRNFMVFTKAGRILTDKGYKCKITDDIISDLGDSVQAFEMMDQGVLGHFEPAYTKDLIYCDVIDVLPVMVAKFCKYAFSRQLKQISEICVNIYNLINESFGFSMDLQQLISRTQNLYIWYVVKKRQFRRLINRVNPKVIVESVYYTINRLVLNEVAHERGVQVIELQHGIISRGHISYNFEKILDNKALPDYIILFADYWKHVARYPIPQDKLVPLGWPYYEEMKNSYPHETNSNSFNILVLSQHAYTDILLRDIKKLISVLDEEKYNYRILYKLHPDESKESIIGDTIWKNDKVVLVDNAKTKLYECFACSNIQIGASSTALFEGLGYNLITFVLDYYGAMDYVGDLCEKGYAQLVEDGEELGMILTSTEMNNVKVNDSFFLTNNSSERIASFIRSCCIEKH